MQSDTIGWVVFVRKFNCTAWYYLPGQEEDESGKGKEVKKEEEEDEDQNEVEKR